MRTDHVGEDMGVIRPDFQDIKVTEGHALSFKRIPLQKKEKEKKKAACRRSEIVTS